MVTDRAAYSALRNGGTWRTAGQGIVINGVRDGNSRWGDRRTALAGEWDELVEQARRLPGFQDFLLPPAPQTLLAAADPGPVVVLNVSRWRCDALVVRADGVEVVRLATLTAAAVTERTADHLDVVAGDQDPPVREERLRSTMEWLWDEVADPVLTALGHTGRPDGRWPRVWWCPTGPFRSLPVHGAGYHAHADGRTVIDRVVSSYTPTLRALREARSHGEVSLPLSVGAADAAGHRHGVATLWAVDAAVATEVDGRLALGAPWPDDAAYALHDAVRGLRDELGLPLADWLPFTHGGP
jgi:hypothetical protein